MIVAYVVFLFLGFMYLWNLILIYGNSNMRVVGFNETYPGYPGLPFMFLFSLIYLWGVRMIYYDEDKEANSAVRAWVQKE